MSDREERKPEDIGDMLDAMTYLYCFGSDAYIKKYYDGDSDRYYKDMAEGKEWLRDKGIVFDYDEAHNGN